MLNQPSHTNEMNWNLMYEYDETKNVLYRFGNTTNGLKMSRFEFIRFWALKCH